MVVEIYHNPRCTSSRNTLQLLEKKGLKLKIRLYLEDHPTQQELEMVVKKLQISAIVLLRKKEEIYKQLVARHGEPTEKKAIEWMVQHPILIERPIVISGSNARIGRPPEAVLEIV